VVQVLPLLNQNQAIFVQMVPLFFVCRKELKIAPFAFFGSKLSFLAYYLSCNGQKMYFLTITDSILVKKKKCKVGLYSVSFKVASTNFPQGWYNLSGL
jgi:hypothetical protein